MKFSKWHRAAIGVVTAMVIPIAMALPTVPANAARVACASHVAGDFNGDGHADVAAGGPGRTVDGAIDAGSVRVFYGGPSGVAPTGSDQYFDQATPGIWGAPTEDDEFGFTVAAGNFNGDCYGDLAIGTPGENDVTILYGSAGGLSTAHSVHLASNQSGSEFGHALAVGDFNGDGIDDLAGGAPTGEDAGRTASGEVGISYGSPSGLRQPSVWIDQSTSGVPGVPEANDYFGSSLAAGDFTHDGRSDLAVGVPGEDNGSIVDAGSVTVLLGSAQHGLSGAGAQLWTQNTPGVSGSDERGDAFGLTLAAGDVNGDGHADLVIGTPYEDLGTVVDAGVVTYLAGSDAGLTAAGARTFAQGSGAIPGAPELADQFGSSLAIGDVNGDGRAEIAVGTPFEDLGRSVDAGAVTIIPGGPGGPTDVGSMTWDENSPGVGGRAETNDDFGYALFAAHITNSTWEDLVIGAPFESTSRPRYTGALTVLRGSAAGLTSVGGQSIVEPTDKAGRAEHDVMGWSLA